MQSKTPNKKQLWQSIDKRININSIYGIDREHFVYEKNKDSVEFGLDYEVRISIIANLDAVAKFDQRQTIMTKK